MKKQEATLGEGTKGKEENEQEADKKKAIQIKDKGNEAIQKNEEEKQAGTKNRKNEKDASAHTKKPEEETDTKKQAAGNVSSKKSMMKGMLPHLSQIKEGKGFLWGTADIYRAQPVEYMIFSMRDFVFYAMFVVLTGLMAFGDLDYLHNYYGNVVSEVLTNSKFETHKYTKTFREIHDIPEIWSYTKEILLKVIHNAFYETYEEFEGFKVLTDSVLVGSPRMRQKRVKNNTCQTAKLFQDLYKSCYDLYRDDIEDRADFGLGHNRTLSAWTYSGPVEDELSFTTSLSSYGLGGFAMNFSSDINLTREWIQELEDNLWIQLGSRVVFIEFALYSPNTNLFCTVKLVFEVLPSGGVTTGSEIITSQIWHESKWDYFLFGCKLIFLVYTMYFTVEEIIQIIILKEAYFSNWWNILDTIIIVVCYTVIITGFSFFLNVQVLNKKIHNIFNSEYSSFDKVRYFDSYKLATAFLTFLVWLKLFKFAKLTKTTAYYLSTFRIATQQIMTLTLPLTGVVAGFATLGSILMDEVLQFRSFTDSFFTLFALPFGGLYFFGANKNSMNTEAKIFFVSYIILVSVIFFSGYVAIIVNGFQRAVFELEDDRTHVYFGDVCHILSYKIFNFWKKSEATADALYRIEAQKLVERNFEGLLEILRRRGCRGMELALLLKKHNLRPGTVIPFEAMCNLYNDFLARCQIAVEVEGHLEIVEKLEKINNTVDVLDMALGDVWTKMDTLANRITIRKGEKKPKKK